MGDEEAGAALERWVASGPDFAEVAGALIAAHFARIDDYLEPDACGTWTSALPFVSLDDVDPHFWSVEVQLHEDIPAVDFRTALRAVVTLDSSDWLDLPDDVIESHTVQVGDGTMDRLKALVREVMR